MSTKVLGVLKPHWTSELLHTGYLEFMSPFGIHGMARKLNPLKLELLALIADDPGNGNFRDFIAAAKNYFECICVWEIYNEWLKGVLERYGFEAATQTEPDGEIVAGMKWEKRKGGRG